jgi:hypothetical protein
MRSTVAVPAVQAVLADLVLVTVATIRADVTAANTASSGSVGGVTGSGATSATSGAGGAGASSAATTSGGTTTATAPAPAAGPAKSPAETTDPAAARKAREEAVKRAQELARTRGSLAARRPSLEFNSVNVLDALKTLAEAGRFNVVFDPGLEAAGIDLANRLITLKVGGGMTYETAIDLVLPKECGYRIEAGYVLITTLEQSWMPLATRTYSIKLALAEVPDFGGHAPRFDVNQVLQRASQTGGGGAGGLFAAPVAAPEKAGQATPDRIIEMVKKFVKNQNDRHIAPWADEGGPATVEYMGGYLIVAQTERGHRALARLLAMIE